MKGPSIDWAAISPLVALTGGACIVLMAGLLRASFVRTALVPGLTIVTLGVAAGLGVWQWDENESVISGALAIDNLTLALLMIFVAGGVAATLLSVRSLAAAEAGHGEYHALLLISVLGMVVLAGAINLVTLFIGFELLSIPLYVLCATELRRERSLESGLKYLIIGSLGSAVLLYGLAMLYGATGSTDFSQIAAAAGDVEDDALFVAAIALIVTGLAFKASVAPFHQWTPDVYEGAPTPITAFMAVATKAAAFGVLIRLFDSALISAADRVGAGVRDAGGGHDRRRQRRRDRAVVGQADARLLVGGAGRLHARGARGLDAARRLGARLLPVRLHGHEPGGVRGDHRARARDALRRRPARAATGWASSGRGWRGRSRSRCCRWRASRRRWASSGRST